MKESKSYLRDYCRELKVSHKDKNAELVARIFARLCAQHEGGTELAEEVTDTVGSKGDRAFRTCLSEKARFTFQ